MHDEVVRRVPRPTNLLNKPVAWRRSLALLMVAAAFAYGWLVYASVSPYAAGADSSGYLNFAQSLTNGNLLARVRVLPGFREMGVYQPSGYTIRDNSGTMNSNLPIGFPMHVALSDSLGVDQIWRWLQLTCCWPWRV